MARQLLSFCLALPLLALWPASQAGAVDLPMRKAGLWEMKVLSTGSQAPEMTMQHCTDETTDKAMSSSFSPMSKDMCSRNDIQKAMISSRPQHDCGPGKAPVLCHSACGAK